ncbi:MAG: ligand-gated channel [Pseudohongiella sp.]|nr:MAG: ligand-gated channel [Pseudohongiella sp.]
MKKSCNPLILAGIGLMPLTAAVPAAFAQSGDVETVVVRGERALESIELEKALTPGGVSTVDVNELMERNVLSLADSLRYVPGVWSTSTSGNDATFFSSRGSNLDATNYDANGIKLLQDGLPVTTADGNNHNRDIDPLSMRAATFARGANALKYGASTLGGAMDFVSATALNTDPMQLYVSGGSFGTRQARATLGGQFGDGMDAMLTLENKTRDGYRDHGEGDRTGFYGNFGWRISDTIDTRFFATYLENEQELPGGLTEAELDADPDQANPATRTGNFGLDVDTQRIANKTTFSFANGSSLELGASQEVQDLFHPIVDVRIDFDGPGPMTPTQVFSLLIDTEQKNTGTMARYQNQIDDHNLLIGFNWGKTTNKGGNYTHDYAVATGLSTIVDNSAESLELFIMDRWSLSDSLTLTYGIQAVDAQREVRNIDAATLALRNPAADYDGINPRAGFIYQASDAVSFFGNVSALYEAPTNFELEDDARGNSEVLNPMEGRVLEVGTRGQHALSADSFWNWDVSLYYAAIDDEILSQDDPNAPGTSLTINVDDTVHAGIEALVSASFATGNGRIEPMLSYTLNDFSFDGDSRYGDNTLPAAPGYVAHGEILYRSNSGFFAGPTFDIVDERYVDFVNSSKIDSYSLLGFRAGLTGNNWQAFVEFKNLTDEEYVTSFSVVNQYAASSRIFNSGEPRSVYAGLQFRF